MDFNILDSLINSENILEREEIERKKEIIYLKEYELEESEENFYDTSDIKDLKNSIELNGIINPVTVAKKNSNSKYKILAGHKRTKACRLLVEEGKKEFEDIPVIILDLDIENEDDYLKAQLILIQTNSTARVLSDFEKMQQAKKTKEILLKMKEKGLKGSTRDLVSEILNISSTQIARYEMIDKNLDEDLKSEFKDGNIGVSVAYELSKKDKEDQKAIYGDYKSGETELTIKNVKAAVKENTMSESNAEFSSYEDAKEEDKRKIYKIEISKECAMEEIYQIILPDEREDLLDEFQKVLVSEGFSQARHKLKYHGGSVSSVDERPASEKIKLLNTKIISIKEIEDDK